MAFNAILEGQIQNLLTKRLGMQGGAPAPVLAPELMPVIVVQAEAAELEYLKGVRLFARGTSQPLDAGSAVAVRLVNPTNSGVIAVVEQLDISVSVAGAAIVVQHYVTTALANSGALGPRDSRGPIDVLTTVLASPLLFSRGALAASVGTEVSRLVLAAGVSQTLRRDFVLAPGGGLDVMTTATNVALSASIVGRFRAAVPGELLG